MKLNRLYKSTKTGATQICDIEVIDDTFIVTFGQLDGKLQTKKTICYPKNLGRSNETSGSEQAIFAAKAKHKSKIKSGYSLDPACTSEVLLPMKVKMYQEQKKNITFPCIVQNKLNGVNGTYRLLKEELILTSRGGEVYKPIPHLEPAIRKMMRRNT